MTMSFDELMAMARTVWGEGLEVSADNLRAAAVGLASSWYRNTDAVETMAHAEGPWGDADMVRQNAIATALCLRALAAVAAEPVDAARDTLDQLLKDLAAQLPTASAAAALLDEKHSAAGVATEWLETNGLGNWLAYLVHAFAYPTRWWGAPGYDDVVDRYCALEPGPPDPETFAERMRTAPWELDDAQAAFVCDRRYDI